MSTYPSHFAEKLSAMVWEDVMLLISYVSCLLTPIEICINQEIHFESAFFVFLLLCDAVAVVDVYFSLKHNLWAPFHLDRIKERVRLDKLRAKNAESGLPIPREEIEALERSTLRQFLLFLTTNSVQNKFTIALRAISASPFFVLPIAGFCGMPDQSLVWMALPRMACVYFLVPFFNQAKSRFESDGKAVTEALSRILLTLMLSLLQVSMLACVWFRMSCEINFIELSRERHCMPAGAEDAVGRWVDFDKVLEIDSTLSCYFRALHFVTQTTFTIGFGDITPRNDSETYFTIFLLLNSCLFYAFLISSLTSLMGNRDVATNGFRAETDLVRKCMALRNTPESLRERVRGYTDYLFTRQKGLSEERFLPQGFTPPALMYSFKALTGEALLRSVPFFKRQELRFVDLCLTRLQFRIYSPGSIVVTQNERRRELLLVRCGRIEIFSPTDDDASGHKTAGKIGGGGSLFTLVAGDYLGDFQLLLGTAAEVSARAAGFVETMVLNFEDFSQVLALTGKEVPAAGKRNDGAETSGLQAGRRARGSWGFGIITDLDGKDSVGGALVTKRPRGGGKQQSSLMLGSVADRLGGVLGRRQSQALSGARSSVTVSTGSSLSGGNGNLRAPLVQWDEKQGLCLISRMLPLPGVQLAVEPKLLLLSLPSAPDPSEWLELHQDALQATVDAHRDFLVKFVRAQSALEHTGRSKRVAEMLTANTQIKRHFTVLPDSGWRLAWDVLLAFAIVYQLFVHPVRLLTSMPCLGQGSLADSMTAEEIASECLSRFVPSMGADYFFDVVLLADIFLRSRVFAFDYFNGELIVAETDPEKIAAQYTASSRYWLSVIICLPMDLLALGWGYVQLWRLWKLTAVLLLPAVTRELRYQLDKRASGLSLPEGAANIAQLILATAVLILWVSVGWAFVEQGAQDLERWTSSFYWCLITTATVGYGDITPSSLSQTLYVIAISVCGPMFYATIIANVASYVHNVNISPENLEYRRNVARAFLAYLNDPGADELRGGSGSDRGSGTRASLSFLATATLPRGSLQLLSGAETCNGGGGGGVGGGGSGSGSGSGGGAEAQGAVSRGAKRASIVGISLPAEPSGDSLGKGIAVALSSPQMAASGARGAKDEGDSDSEGEGEECKDDQSSPVAPSPAKDQGLRQQTAPSPIARTRGGALIPSSRPLVLAGGLQNAAGESGSSQPVAASALLGGPSLSLLGFASPVSPDIAKITGPDSSVALTVVTESATATSLVGRRRPQPFGPPPVQVARAAQAAASKGAPLVPVPPAVPLPGSAPVPVPVASAASLLANTLNYYDYLDRERLGCEEGQMLRNTLPQYLHDDLRAHIARDFIRISGLFTGMDESLLREVALVMELRVYVKNEIMLDCAPRAASPEGAFFVKSGLVRVLEKGERRLVHRHPNEMFGEAALLEPADAGRGCWGKTLCFRAQTDCEVLVLPRRCLQAIARLHPAASDQFAALKQALLQRLEDSKAAASAGMATRALMNADLKMLAKMQELRESAKLFINPNKTLGLSWCVLVMFCTLFLCAILPVNIAFWENSPIDTATLVTQYLVDAIFLVDVVLRMFFLAYFEQNDMVMVRRKIFDNYTRRGSFAMHIVALLPLDLLALGAPVAGLSPLQSLAVLRVNRLLRLWDLPSLIEQLERAIQARAAAVYSKNSIRLAKLVAVIFIAAHFMGSAFFFIANSLHRAGHESNWADKAGILRECTLGTSDADTGADPVPGRCYDAPNAKEVLSQYTHAVYWAATTIYTVGYGDIVPISDVEKGFCLFVVFVGACIYAQVIIHLHDIVSQLDVTADIYQSKLGQLKVFMEREAFSEALTQRVIAHYTRLWAVQKGATGEEIAVFIPPRLYGAATHRAVERVLGTLFFFNSELTTHEFVVDVCSRLVTHHYLAGDLVARAGEPGRTLFLLLSGSVMFVRLGAMGAGSGSGPGSGSGQDKRKSIDSGAAEAGSGSPSNNENKHTVFCNVHEGAVGDAEFFLREVYSCDVQAAGDVSMLELNFDDFWQCLLTHGLEAQYLDHLSQDAPQAQLVFALTASRWARFSTNFKSTKMNKMMLIEQPVTKSTPVILPDSLASRSWAWLQLASVCYIALTGPYLLAFYRELFWPYLVCDVLFLVLQGWADVYLRLNLFAVVKDGCSISDPVKFRAQYASTELRLDLVASAPLPLLIFAALLPDPLLAIRVYSVARIVHLAKLARAQANFRSALASIEAISKRRVGTNTIRVTETMLMVCFFAHMVSCMFCLLGTGSAGSVSGAIGGNNWVSLNHFDNRDSFAVYTQALYWSLYTIVTVGYGNILLATDVERLFAMLVMTAGAIICDAGVAAILSSIVGSADRLAATVMRQHQSLLRFLVSNHLDTPVTLQPILSHHKYQTHGLCNVQDFDSMAALPAHIRIDWLGRYSTWLERILFVDPALMALDDYRRKGLVMALLREMVPIVCLPGSHITPPVPLSGAGWDESVDLVVFRRGTAWAILASDSRSSAPTRHPVLEGQVCLPECFVVAAMQREAAAVAERRQRKDSVRFSMLDSSNPFRRFSLQSPLGMRFALGLGAGGMSSGLSVNLDSIDASADKTGDSDGSDDSDDSELGRNNDCDSDTLRQKLRAASKANLDVDAVDDRERERRENLLACVTLGRMDISGLTRPDPSGVEYKLVAWSGAVKAESRYYSATLAQRRPRPPEPPPPSISAAAAAANATVSVSVSVSVAVAVATSRVDVSPPSQRLPTSNEHTVEMDQVLLLRLPRYMDSLTLHLVRQQDGDEEVLGVAWVSLKSAEGDSSSSSASDSDSDSSTSSDSSDSSDGGGGGGGGNAKANSPRRQTYTACNSETSSAVPPPFPAPNALPLPLSFVLPLFDTDSDSHSGSDSGSDFEGGSREQTPPPPGTRTLIFEYTGRPQPPPFPSSAEYVGDVDCNTDDVVLQGGYCPGDRSAFEPGKRREDEDDEDEPAPPPVIRLSCVVEALTADRARGINTGAVAGAGAHGGRRASVAGVLAGKGATIDRASTHRVFSVAGNDNVTQGDGTAAAAAAVSASTAPSRQRLRRVSTKQIPGICKFLVLAETYCHCLSVPAVKVREIVKYYTTLTVESQLSLGQAQAQAQAAAPVDKSKSTGQDPPQEDEIRGNVVPFAAATPRDRYCDLPSRTQRRVSFTPVPAPTLNEAEFGTVDLQPKQGSQVQVQAQARVQVEAHQEHSSVAGIAGRAPPLQLLGPWSNSSFSFSASQSPGPTSSTSTGSGPPFSGRRGSHCSIQAMEDSLVLTAASPSRAAGPGSGRSTSSGPVEAGSAQSSPQVAMRRKSLVLRMDKEVTDLDEAVQCDVEVHKALGLTSLVNHLKHRRDSVCMASSAVPGDRP